MLFMGPDYPKIAQYRGDAVAAWSVERVEWVLGNTGVIPAEMR